MDSELFFTAFKHLGSDVGVSSLKSEDDGLGKFELLTGGNDSLSKFIS